MSPAADNPDADIVLAFNRRFINVYRVHRDSSSELVVTELPSPTIDEGDFWGQFGWQNGGLDSRGILHVASAFGSATSAPTDTQRQGYEIAATQFTGELEEIRSIRDKDLKAIEDAMESACAPYTPGRLPRWIKE